MWPNAQFFAQYKYISEVSNGFDFYYSRIQYSLGALYGKMELLWKISASEKIETELHKYDKVFEPLGSSDDGDANAYHDMIDHQDYEELIKGEHTESGIFVLKDSQHYLKLNRSTI